MDKITAPADIHLSQHNRFELLSVEIRQFITWGGDLIFCANGLTADLLFPT